MHHLWLVAFAQLALALRVAGHTEASALAVSLGLAMVGWLLAQRRREDR